ncbi:MAG: hypothetical protein ACRDVP_09475 [Acidimicrobiales bacterium]
MSPAPRRDRKRFVIGLVAGAIVLFLLVGGLASAGRSSGPYRFAINRAFGAQARVLVDQSNRAGAELRNLVGEAPRLSRTQLAAGLGALTSSADETASQAPLVASPAPSSDLGPMFVSVMQQRMRAVESVANAMNGLLALVPINPPGSPPASNDPAARQLTSSQFATTVEAAGRSLGTTDRLYAQVRKAFEDVPGGFALPRSVWVGNPLLWAPGAIQTVTNQITSAPGLAPLVDLKLVALDLNPPLLPPAPGIAGQPQGPSLPPGVVEVPPTCTLAVTAVVANEGSVGVSHVALKVSVRSTAGGAPFVVRKTVSLAPLLSSTLSLSVVPVVPGETYVVSAVLDPPPGQIASTGDELATIEVAPFGTAAKNRSCARLRPAAP